VEQALVDRRIVRTWMYRGTLHYVAVADLGWLTALLAPTIIRKNARRYRQLELDGPHFVASQRVMLRALEDRGAMTRREIGQRLEAEGISAEGQRLPYLLQRAALDGLICHGETRGKETTYVLLKGWGGGHGPAGRDELLGRLAGRYLGSHAPATRQDFAWWSGLGAAEARQAIESTPSAASFEYAGVEYWLTRELCDEDVPRGAHLLPPFDGYLMGYRDRDLVLDPANARRVNAGGGLPKPTVLLDGRVAGVWRRESTRSGMAIEVAFFDDPGSRERQLVEAAASLFGEYSGSGAQVSWSKGHS
jgi:hypothetical protein